MKSGLPPAHGLSRIIQDNLLFTEGGAPSLTDAQWEALDAGVGRGESMLVVSPTSTGKTQIAMWAIARSIEARGNTVYLVTHRALAKQKAEDFKRQLLPTLLSQDTASLVLATGDTVEDASGELCADPLHAPLLVATYEKYLALLSASGIPKDMRSTTIVCDEVQLIGDANRGQHVEVLLALLRNAGWKQFVGLSAVLQERDARDLASWLGLKLVVQHTREKHLRYECWTPDGMAVASTERPGEIQEGLQAPGGGAGDAIEVLAILLREPRPPLPIIVWCMTKPTTYDLVERFLRSRTTGGDAELSLALDGLPQTAASSLLARTLPHRLAVHSADLTEEERAVVEQQLRDGQLDVVFATSTLAAGVNFPLGAAVFADWIRWDSKRRARIPIDAAEFHNMAGRVGRMGFVHEEGRVILLAGSKGEARLARSYLDLGSFPDLEPRIDPEQFDQLALQWVSSGLCWSKEAIETLVCSTFSAMRAQDRNLTGFKEWPRDIEQAVEGLLVDGLLVRGTDAKLSATPVGKATSQSGLLPSSSVFLLNHCAQKAERLVAYLPTESSAGDLPRLAFLLFAACLACPEFRPRDRRQPTRLLPWPLGQQILFNAAPYAADLPEPVWEADIALTNAASLACDWIEGMELGRLEEKLPSLRAGMLRDLYRNLGWVLQGLAAILTAAGDERVPEASRLEALKANDTIRAHLAKLPRVVRRFGWRVGEGLPDDVLWLVSIGRGGADFRLNRTEILALRAGGLASPERVQLGSPEADAVRVAAFAKARPAPQVKANWLRDSSRRWKQDQRKRAAERQRERAQKCANVGLIDRFYASVGIDLEKVFEEILTLLRISFEKLDDKSKTGAPDYLITLTGSPSIVLEVKSHQGDKLVNYTHAVEVLAASEVHGHKDAFCVTLCHPGVDPAVSTVVAACGRLSVVESNDLGEALLRHCEGTITEAQLWQWLVSPGQALAADLPFREEF